MGGLSRQLWLRLVGLLPGEVNHSEARWLLSPYGHMPLMNGRRARIIVNRVRLVACLFAILTPLWIVVDLLVLPLALSWQLAVARLLASLAFMALHRHYRAGSTLLQAWGGMACLFAIPSVFYVVSHLLLLNHHLQGISAAIGTGYAFLPFVLLAGLAIFPLTLAECIGFALPALAAHILGGMLEWTSVDWPSFWGSFWLQVLIAGVAALACISQLAFMIALVQQAVRDPLTGAFSRRSGEEVLELQATLAMRCQSPLSVAFIDIDHFKSINDRFGHHAGDCALQTLAELVVEQLRKGDVLVRWGGEEFLLLLPNTTASQAVHALGRLRQGGLGLRPDGEPLTASIGVAEWQEDGVNDWRQLLELADSRMYQAKQNGRNRLVTRNMEQHCWLVSSPAPAVA
ncbi:GGDEF domain-containing protein [Vogesella oryzae]|uniref:GGDEF domain-containing protein n=1 Tax=Vogesella oryzae TaxID=1735285 RepID=UPI00158186D5|nr:GGDEF domain-containing protein [Vogesella oryzae]